MYVYIKLYNSLFKETVINALKTERDVSVRQRAVDLLYAMCDRYPKFKHKNINKSCYIKIYIVVTIFQLDISIMCIFHYRTNSEDIVLEMLTYLETADYSIREEMV